jgi:gamma-glutamylcyclotransferase (GGCT)/AIG2-like uncharacterized protein YtfP
LVPGRNRALQGNYNPFSQPAGATTEETTLLYFAYTARIAPQEMRGVAPGAEFQFIAHLAEWGLEFPIDGNGWNGGLPTVVPTTGSTVWGAVFAVPDDQIDALNAVEGTEHRVVSTVEAIDRTGKRHQVVTHVFDGSNNGRVEPSPAYLRLMLAGSKHWSLPAGWIAGLEEHLEASGGA